MNLEEAVKRIRGRLIELGRAKEIPAAMEKLKALLGRKASGADVELAYLDGVDAESYVHDMKVAQKYAQLNRSTIAGRICAGMGWAVTGGFETVHNYLGDDGIIRKSAVSARKGERLIIPMNMRDGSAVCVGKGNEDWNWSAPHGAGRLMSRTEARRRVGMEEFRESMSGIYTTSVCEGTLDEAPQAYKPAESILRQIGPTVDVVKVMRPVYSFKASEKAKGA